MSLTRAHNVWRVMRRRAQVWPPEIRHQHWTQGNTPHPALSSQGHRLMRHEYVINSAQTGRISWRHNPLLQTICEGAQCTCHCLYLATRVLNLSIRCGVLNIYIGFRGLAYTPGCLCRPPLCCPPLPHRGGAQRVDNALVLAATLADP